MTASTAAGGRLYASGNYVGTAPTLFMESLQAPATVEHLRATYVRKACAYITRDDCSQLLVFRGPDHDGLQIPKGTVEPGESPAEAVQREIAEESGLDVDSVRPLVADVWTRRTTPLKKYVRHFFHADVDEPRDQWRHVVSGDGPECGCTFRFSWIDLPADRSFALSLDDYVQHLPRRTD